MASQPNAVSRSLDGGKASAGAPACLMLAPVQLLAIALAADSVLLASQSVLMSLFVHQTLWQTSWVVAAVFMGTKVLHWPPAFDFAPLTAAITALYPTSLACVLVLTAGVRRLRLGWYILAGALVGLLFYCGDLYGFTKLFPWLARECNWMDLLSHAVFGAATAFLLARAVRRAAAAL